MDGPPELSVRIPNSRDLPKDAYLLTELSKNLVIDFLLVTAVDCEFLSCFYYLQEPLKYYDTNTGIVYVGKMGDEGEEEKLTIGLVKCGMGSGVGGSASTVQNVVTTLRPKGVFCVGFCGGMNARKAKLGDVVVSKELISYALHKATDAGIEPRGTKVPLNKMVNGIMKHAGDGWDPPLKDKAKAGKVVNGTMLSGPTLVNSKQELNRLLKHYPTATAIEMEGEGNISLK